MTKGSGSCISVLKDPTSYAGTLDHAIDRDASGSAITGMVWTATQPTGAAISGIPSQTTCINWTDPGATLGDAGASKGGIGNSANKDATWTQTDPQTCNLHARLYCFQSN